MAKTGEMDLYRTSEGSLCIFTHPQLDVLLGTAPDIIGIL